MNIRSFRKSDADDVIKLWKDCGLVVPWNDPTNDIQRKLLVQSELFLIGTLDNEIIASAMAGYDGHRGWVYYLAVHPNHQKFRYGKKMMESAERLLIEMGCPKINIMVRESNLDVIKFYKETGYAVQEVATLGKRLIADN